MTRAAMVAAMALLIASLGTCAWSMANRGEIVRPVDARQFGALLPRAAKAAQGLRVLVILAKPGASPEAQIFDTAKDAEGWQAYAPTADAADPLARTLTALAVATATDFVPDRRLEEPTLRALAIFGVAIVAATDGSAPIVPEIGERDASVAPAPDVPGLRVRHAQPVFLFLAEGAEATPDDPIGFARTLRRGDANFLYPEDGRWGGAVTVEAAQAGEFLFPWSAAGARVTIDDEPSPHRAARVPLLLVKVPAGRHRVDVRYGEERTAREWLPIAAAVVAVVAFVALWLGLRPHPQETPPAA